MRTVSLPTPDAVDLVGELPDVRFVVWDGTGEPPEPDYWLLPAGRHDRLLVCSDGLVRELSDDDVARTLGGYADPQDAADRLVAAAVTRGGRDNVSVVVVDLPFVPVMATTRPLSQRDAISSSPITGMPARRAFSMALCTG